MHLRSSLRAVCTLLAIVFAARCQSEELPPKVVEFFRARDRWLLENIIAEAQPPKREASVQEALKEEEGRAAETRKDLEALQQRNERNKNKPSLASLVKKGEAHAKELADALQASAKRIGKLREDLVDEEQRNKTAEAEWLRDLPDLAIAKLNERRADLSVMPPNAGTLEPGHLEIGTVGVLPQWPVRISDGRDELTGKRVIDVNFVHEVVTRLAAGGALREREQERLDSLAAGGSANAEKRHNLRVVQVFDERRLLVSFIGAEFLDWPLLLLDLGDTGGYADDSTLRVDWPLMVTGTERYKAVNGAGQTVFVLKAFNVEQIPPCDAAAAKALAESFVVAPNESGSWSADVDESVEATNTTGPILEPTDFRVGAIGVLPQWPVGYDERTLSSSFRRSFEAAVGRARKAQTSASDQLRPYVRASDVLLEPYGGRIAAKGRYNLRVVQVFDAARLLVTFTGNKFPAQWPLFLLDLDDTSELADGSTLCIDGRVEVMRTEPYTAVGGASRTIFVLKPLDPQLKLASQTTRTPLPAVEQRKSQNTAGGTTRSTMPALEQKKSQARARYEEEIEAKKMDIERQEAELTEAESEIRKLEEKLGRLQRSVPNGARPKAKTKSAIEQTKIDLKRARARADKARRAIDSNQRAIDAARGQLQGL
jgi:hypothetical protein